MRSEGEDATTKVRGPAPSILIVDDHRANLVAMEAVLGPLGFDLVMASSGAEALQRIAEHDFVLILMDVHMPGLDGYQTTSLLRAHERSRGVPVVFVTAVHDVPEHVHRGYALGAVDYITKPFDPKVLCAKVKALVSLYTRGGDAERERSNETERLRSLFLGVVGHDLRDPLNAIFMAAQLMAATACSDANHAKNARRIEGAARRMKRIIEDILDLTRGQLTEGIPTTPRPTDLGAVCKTIVDESQLTHPGRPVELEVRGEVTGLWDPERLARVAANIVGNALAYGDEGAIRVHVLDEGDRVALAVHNRGAPIDEAKLPTLFEPFHRGETTAAGLGLGLYIAREIVRAHRGTIEVTSTASEGTTFTVLLPRNPPAGDAA
ncbi:MAG TPA: hybrid sensor histidine kinase/response regulator [Polyangiaceae bacterium]|nr:hybrid sensor histidine kinase/response regulator [Polyangiaceae bacterium]